jgi:hypothetical protein
MRAIDRKLVRDLRGMRGQAIAIVLVILAGVSTYVAMTSVMHSLVQSQEVYYQDYRFADGFARFGELPNALRIASAMCRASARYSRASRQPSTWKSRGSTSRYRGCCTRYRPRASRR